MIPLINLSQQRVVEFFQEEFSKIKDFNSQRKSNRKIKLVNIEKKTKSLLNNIELILKTTSINDEIKNKIIIIKNEVENYRF